MLRTLFIMAGLVLGVSAGLRGEETPPDASAPPAEAKKPALSAEEIAKLIADLDSDDYAVREAATKALRGAGIPAVKPLGEAAVAGSLELGVRAVRILESFYTSQDTDLVTAAEGALDELASSKKRSIAARAELVFSLHEDVAERVAVAKILSLGGIPKYFDSRFEPRLVEPKPGEGEEPQPVEIVILRRDWKGGDEGLKYVRRLPQLKSLYVVTGAGVSEKALKELQSVLPELMIEYRGPAYLGVAMTQTTRGSLIREVTPGSAAQKAGLRTNDVVLQFGDVTVTRPEDVIEAIKGMQPGDKVHVVLERDGNPITLDVTIGDWGAE